MYSLILSKQKRVVSAFVVAVLISAAFIFGIIFNAKGATFNITSPSGGSCYIVGTPIPIAWTPSTLGGVNHYAVYYTTNDGSTKTLIPAGHPVTATSINWTPDTFLIGLPIKIVIDGHDSAHTTLETAMSSTSFGISTSCGGGGGGIPSAPTSLYATATLSTQVQLSWPASSGTDHYNIYRRTPAGSGTWTTINGSWITTTSYTDNSVIASTSYDYRIESCLSGSGCSSSNNSFAYAYNITTPASGGGTAPNAPTNLTASPYSSSRIDLTWTDNSNNETDFKVYRRSPAGSGTFTLWATFASPSVTSTGTTIYYSDNAVSSGTSYDYYVKAYVANYFSGESNYASATPSGSADTSAPSIPTGVYINSTQITNSSIIVSWNASTDNVGVVGYKIYRCVCGGTSNMQYLGSSTTTSYQDNGLLSGTSYTYTIAAYDAAPNTSSQSSGATGTTSGTAGSTFALTVNKSGSGNGTISSSPSGVNCATDCSTTSYAFASGTSVTLYASPNTGSTFTGWSGACTGTICVLTINAAYTASATFTVSGSSDNTAPVISNLGEQDIIGMGAKVKWLTDDMSDSFVEYGTSVGNYTNNSTSYCYGSGLVTDHCLYLTNLVYNTTYFYRVRSVNAAGLQIQATGDFQSALGTNTSGVPSTPSNFRLEPAPVTSPTPTIYLKWNATTDADKYNLSRSQHGLNAWTYFPQLMGNTNTSYSDSSVGVSVYYDYRVEACHSGFGCSYTSAYLYNVSVGGTTTTTTQNGSISGKVTTSSNVAVAGANLNLRSPDNVYNFYTTASSDGTYHFDNLLPYSYVLIAYPPATRTDLSPSSPQNIAIAASQNTARDIQLVSGTKILTGRILRSDGRIVTNAQVGAWRVDGQPGGGMANSDANGNYTLTLSGGRWNISVHPIDAASSSADWFYNFEPSLVEFILDSSSESKTLNFTVTSQNSFITGTIKNPDGSNHSSTTSRVDFFNSTARTGSGGTINSDGTFRVAIGSGTYDVNIYISDPTLYAAQISSVAISDNQTKDLGIITLRKRGELIRGKVYGPNGEGVSGVEVNGYLSGTSNYTSAISKTDGTYEMNVSVGTWNLGLNSSTLGGYTYVGSARSVSVYAGSTISFMDFALAKAGSVISGTVVDSSGNIIADFYGPVGITPQDGFGTNIQGYSAYAQLGAFTVSVPPGNYNVQVFPAYGSNYSPSALVPVNVLSGVTTKVSVAINRGDSVIQGTVRNSAGGPVSGIKMKVFASNNKGAWRESDVNTTTGTYKLNVFAGTWQVGLSVEGTGYTSAAFVTVTVIAGQTVNQDISLLTSNSSIVGKVLSPAGVGVGNVQVAADINSFSQNVAPTTTTVQSFKAITDISGNYKIMLPPGTYYLHTFLSSGNDFISAPEQVVMLVNGETKTVDLTLRSPSSTLTGKAYEGTQGRPAFIWAWGENGGGFSSTASADGSYSLKLSPGRWKVGGSYERDQIYFRSAEVVIEIVSGSSNTLNIYLVDSKVFLPLPIVKTGTTSTDQVVTNENGATVNIPSNSISSSGPVTLTLSPSTDAPSQGTSNVVGVAYEVEVKDQTGKSVTSLNVPATVSIPYDEKSISAGEETLLNLAFWDEALGAWQEVNSAVVDTVNNIITGSVSHLTRFAIVRPADITPPASPTSVRAKVATDKITFSWINPSIDFHSVKVYRSTLSGDIGSKIADNITLTSWSDSSVQQGTKYYYNIKAVDLAGNESTSRAQTAVTAGEVSSSQAVGPYPSGTLFKAGTNPTVWYVENGKRRGIPSLGVFESRFDWKNVKNITDATHTELYTEDSAIGYPDGLLIKGSAPTVYIIADGKKLPVTTAEAFNALGYKWENIRTVNDSELGLHATGASLSTAAGYPSGSLIQKEGDPTVWFVDKGVRRGIPTLDVFNMRKLDFKRVVKVPSSVLDSIQIGSALAYPDYTLVKGSAPEVYFVEGGKKRHITSGEIFNTNQFDWAAIRTIPDSVLNLMATGSNLE